MTDITAQLSALQSEIQKIRDMDPEKFAALEKDLIKALENYKTTAKSILKRN